ncbi:MAG: TraR/DksA family transcriptional regulator [Bacteroidota bacterium]|jgi:RNA polymerase-binding transcription factor DksA|nr:TraR/DksA family transcriptional regulator [Chitinophagaceae bacterium]MCE2758287.1 TraR/DksA family transcriptional regulator [Chitinophagaceae bacterium]
MATKKPAPKKAAKPVKKAKPAPKKAVPAKKVAASKSTAKKAKPVKKAAKPAPKKAVKPAPKKAAPVKKAAKPAPKKPVAKKAVPVKAAKPAPKKAVPAPKNMPAKTAPSKAVPAKATKTVPVKGAKPVPVKGAKPIPAKGAKPAPGNKPAGNSKSSGKKVPLISPETRFAGTSTKVATQAEIRKALRAKEAVKNLKPVPMPKITTKTARKYEPEFTKSVLDSKQAVDQTGPTQRYSDVDLAEFRELVQHKLNAAKQELAYLNGLITRKDSMSGEDSDSRYMTMEDGSLSMEREQLSQMASRQIDFIEKLEKALMRIENKTYGICRVTGRLIDKARLKAVPHATLSMEAKMGMSRGGFNNNANQ